MKLGTHTELKTNGSVSGFKPIENKYTKLITRSMLGLVEIYIKNFTSFLLVFDMKLFILNFCRAELMLMCIMYIRFFFFFF